MHGGTDTAETEPFAFMECPAPDEPCELLCELLRKLQVLIRDLRCFDNICDCITKDHPANGAAVTTHNLEALSAVMAAEEQAKGRLAERAYRRLGVRHPAHALFRKWMLQKHAVNLGRVDKGCTCKQIKQTRMAEHNSQMS